MKQIKDFEEKLEKLMACSPEDLSKCIKRQKDEDSQKKVLKKILK